MDPKLAARLAANLRAAMGANWNQNQLAKALGMTRAGVGRLYHGTALPSIVVFVRLCRTLKVSADTLLGLKRPRGR